MAYWAKIGVQQVRRLDTEELAAVHWSQFDLTETEAIEVEEAINMFTQGITIEWPHFSTNGAHAEVHEDELENLDESIHTAEICPGCDECGPANETKPPAPPVIPNAELQEWTRGEVPHAPSIYPTGAPVLIGGIVTHKGIVPFHNWLARENAYIERIDGDFVVITENERKKFPTRRAAYEHIASSNLMLAHGPVPGGWAEKRR